MNNDIFKELDEHTIGYTKGQPHSDDDFIKWQKAHDRLLVAAAVREMKGFYITDAINQRARDYVTKVTEPEPEKPVMMICEKAEECPDLNCPAKKGHKPVNSCCDAKTCGGFSHVVCSPVKPEKKPAPEKPVTPEIKPGGWVM